MKSFHEQLKELAEKELGISKEESQMTFKERMEAKKAAMRAKVKANFDKKEADAKAEKARQERIAKADEFQKAHAKKMREKILADKISGKY